MEGQGRCLDPVEKDATWIRNPFDGQFAEFRDCRFQGVEIWSLGVQDLGGRFELDGFIFVFSGAGLWGTG